MKRWVALLVMLAVCAVGSTATAQEIQLRGPLAGAPSCRHCVLYRQLRLSVAPTYGITLQDAFDRSMFFGLQINFHVADIFAIGVWGAYDAVHINTSLTSQVENTPGYTGSGDPNIPMASHFHEQIGQFQWFLSAPQLTLIPLRGKLALFQNIFLDVDFYIFAGLGIIGFSERAPYDANMPTAIYDAQNHVVRRNDIAFTATFGAGLNFYITHFLSLSVEYRAFPFAFNLAGTDESSASNLCGPNRTQSCAGFPDYAVDRDVHGGGGRFLIDNTDRSFNFNQMVNFGINIFLPPGPHFSD